MLVDPFSIVPKSAGVVQTTSVSTSPTTVIVNGYGSLGTTKLAVIDPVAVVKITGFPSGM